MFQKKNISRNVGHQLTFKTTWQNIIWSESIQTIKMTSAADIKHHFNIM